MRGKPILRSQLGVIESFVEHLLVGMLQKIPSQLRKLAVPVQEKYGQVLHFVMKRCLSYSYGYGSDVQTIPKSKGVDGIAAGAKTKLRRGHLFQKLDS